MCGLCLAISKGPDQEEERRNNTLNSRSDGHEPVRSYPRHRKSCCADCFGRLMGSSRDEPSSSHEREKQFMYPPPNESKASSSSQECPKPFMHPPPNAKTSSSSQEHEKEFTYPPPNHDGTPTRKFDKSQLGKPLSEEIFDSKDCFGRMDSTPNETKTSSFSQERPEPNMYPPGLKDGATPTSKFDKSQRPKQTPKVIDGDDDNVFMPNLHAKSEKDKGLETDHPSKDSVEDRLPHHGKKYIEEQPPKERARDHIRHEWLNSDTQNVSKKEILLDVQSEYLSTRTDQASARNPKYNKLDHIFHDSDSYHDKKSNREPPKDVLGHSYSYKRSNREPLEDVIWL